MSNDSRLPKFLRDHSDVEPLLPKQAAAFEKAAALVHGHISLDDLSDEELTEIERQGISMTDLAIWMREDWHKDGPVIDAGREPLRLSSADSPKTPSLSRPGQSWRWAAGVLILLGVLAGLLFYRNNNSGRPEQLPIPVWSAGLDSVYTRSARLSSSPSPMVTWALTRNAEDTESRAVTVCWLTQELDRSTLPSGGFNGPPASNPAWEDLPWDRAVVLNTAGEWSYLERSQSRIKGLTTGTRIGARWVATRKWKRTSTGEWRTDAPPAELAMALNEMLDLSQQSL